MVSRFTINKSVVCALTAGATSIAGCAAATISTQAFTRRDERPHLQRRAPPAAKAKGTRDALRWSLAAVAVALGLCAGSAQAAFVVAYDTPYTPAGAAPAGSPSWATATFTDAGVNSVRLTLDLNLQAASEFATSFYFSIDPALSLSGLGLTVDPGASPSSAAFAASQDGINVPGGYRADLRIIYSTANNANRFTGTETSSLLIRYTGTGTLDAQSFAFLLGGSGSGNRPNVYSAMHVQGLGSGGSVQVGATVPTPAVVPEPGSLGLAALGVLMLLGLTGRGRR